MGAMMRTADQELVRYVESAAAGDELAFARIVSALHESVYSIVMVVCMQYDERSLEKLSVEQVPA